MDASSTNVANRNSRVITLLWLLAALALFSFGFRTISHSSVWMHLASGRVIAEQGIPTHDPFSFTTDAEGTWVNPHWLYDLILFRAWQAVGPSGVVTLHALLGLAAFLLAIAAGQRLHTRTATAATLLIGGWLMAPVFQVGPALVALALAGLTMFQLSRTGGTPASWLILIPVQLLWTNIHGSFLLPTLLTLAYAIQVAMGPKPASKNARLTIPKALVGLAAVLLLVTLLNPYGLGLHRQVIATVTNPSLGVLTEWISPFSAEFTTSWYRHISTGVLILVASGFVLVRERLPLAPTLTAVIGAFLMVLSPRYVAFSALLVSPFLAMSITNLGYIIRQKQGGDESSNRLLSRIAVVLLAVASMATLFTLATNRYYLRTGSASSFGSGVAADATPEAACAKVISRPDFPERALNLASDGGYLAWRLPGRKIFTDSRSAVYGAAFYQGLGRGLLGQQETWSNLVTRWQPEAVILNGSWPGSGAALRQLVDDKVWSLVYFDGISAVLVLRTTQHRALISDLDVQLSGLKDLDQARQNFPARDGILLRAPVPARLVGAGVMYLALGRFREAAAIYETITPRLPDYVTGWLNLGICRLEQKNVDGSIRTLIQASRMRSDLTLAWLWLNRAYTEKGLSREAEAALRKARDLNKTMADAFEQIGKPSTNTPPPAAAAPGATTSKPGIKLPASLSP